MLLTVLLTSLVALAGATGLLVALGRRLHLGSVPVSALLALAFSALAATVALRLWHLPSTDVVVGGLWIALVSLVVILARPMWNPVGQLFFATTVAAAGSYLALAGWLTVSGVLSPAAAVGSAGLWLVEAAAFAITISFAFESCDVVCRARWTRSVPAFDRSYLPKVSLHVPAYAEPPDMLIETIASLEALDYPDFEIVVVDNNTADEGLWRPVERYCAGRPRIRFAHVNPWPGFKSGALNLALRAHTDPAAEIIGVIDADYIVRAEYLRETVGYFVSPQMAFVQTPQDYREWEGDTYLTACHDAYRYFFETAMPSRNDRNSIIFGGTMGLIRRSVLEEIGGWDESCITEDAEASLRILRSGYEGFYVNRSFGQGIMPLTFGALKRQMFRWCFGGIQILRRHGRSLMPWDRRAENRLSMAQRFDYLLGGLQWFGNLVGLAFTVILGLSAATLLLLGRLPFGPLLGAAVLLPLSLLVSGLIRAMWALRDRANISYRRAGLAFLTWLSLSWTIAMACLQGLARTAQPFIRTPKWRGEGGVIEALRATRAESTLAAAALTTALFFTWSGRVGVLVVLLFAWQAAVYAASPTMAWLNQRSHLPIRLERLRRADERRERFGSVRPHLVRAGLGTVIGALAAVVVVGSLSATSGNDNRLHLVFTPPSDQPPAASTGSNPTNSPGSTTKAPGATGTGSSRPALTHGSVSSGTPGSGAAGAGTTTTTPAGAGTTTTTATNSAGSSTTTTRPGATTTSRPAVTTTTHPGATTTTPPSTVPSQATTTTNAHQP